MSNETIVKLTDHTGGFTFPTCPPNNWILNPIKFTPTTYDQWPWIYPNDPLVPQLPTWPEPFIFQPTHITTSTASVFTLIMPWRVKAFAEGVELSIDVPGVKIEDIKLEAVDGVLKLDTKRADTGISNHHEYVFGGSSYDLGLTKAKLSDGVLTVTLISVYAKKSHKIIVESA